MKKGLRSAIERGYKEHGFGGKKDDKPSKGSDKKKEPKGSEKNEEKKDSRAKKTGSRIPKPQIRTKVIRIGGSAKPWYKNPVLWILVAVIIGVFAFQFFRTPTPEEKSLGELVSKIKEDKVEEVDVSSTRATAKLKEDEGVIYAVIPSQDKFQDALIEAEIPITQDNIKYHEDTGSWVDIVSTLVYVIMIGGVIFFVFSFSRQMQKGGGGILGMGESKAKIWAGKKQRISFKDVAGVDEAVNEVQEIVEFLKNPKKFVDLGARIPKGVLVVGPPGTGKTLLARAIAGEAGVPFFFTSGSEFEEMLVGAGASRVRDLFAKAKKAAPAIIFVDEIDAVGRKRGTVLHTGTAEQTLNQILVEMDGFDKHTNVIIIGATNRPDVLDPALLRPGRFDRIVALDLPDISARKDILDVHAKGKPFAEDVDLDRIARRTVGLSGADLENVLNEAAILAARRDKTKISMDEITEAITKIQLGPAKKKMQSEHEKKMIAYHEAGHAIVSHFLPEADDVLRVSIVARGMSLGATESLPKEEHERIRTKTKLESDIATLVAGHVSEKIAFGETATGAENDIKRATKLARAMVTKYGMSELGPVQFGEEDESNKYLGFDYAKKPFSEKSAAKVDAEVSRIVDEAYQRAENILSERREILDELVEALLEKETLDSDEFEKIVGPAKKES